MHTVHGILSEMHLFVDFYGLRNRTNELGHDVEPMQKMKKKK